MVFPFVPVTPASSSSFVGSPKKTSAATAIDSRVDGTTSCGTSTSSSRSTTSGSRTALDRLPGEVVPVDSLAAHAEEQRTRRRRSAVSYARSPIVTGRPPATSLGARARIRASSSMFRRIGIR